MPTLADVFRELNGLKEKRRERAWQLIESEEVDRTALKSLLEAHGVKVDIDNAN